ncbi:ABC protein, sub ABCG [Dermatophagoides farinae]|uniref:ABC protein, sub ABCG n=1 Tax=Dermatophagoides farinae TaxID=6954 RepID=A0A922HW52_DERFA|nr:ABC protein, sub ABCG [Dermatophagoides farinae]
MFHNTRCIWTSIAWIDGQTNDEEREGQIVEHEKIAKTLLDELDISDTEDTLVQDCSGGERKRLALALELTALRMPNLICIDEPTSGLDSNSAYIVVACLRRQIHRHNLTIVASIHQPNTEVLMMFDQCYVLARGGVFIYSGPPDQIIKLNEQQMISSIDNCDLAEQTQLVIDGVQLNRPQFSLRLVSILCQRYMDIYGCR